MKAVRYNEKVSEQFSVLRERNEFDRTLWGNQTDTAKFAAVHGMILDYLLITTGKRDEPRLDRTVESFQRL